MQVAEGVREAGADVGPRPPVEPGAGVRGGDSEEHVAAGESGRARVRRVLIGPLVGMGMRRRKGVSEAEQEEWLDRLEGRLAYLPEMHLRHLQATILRHAANGEARGGVKARDVWPSEAAILNWARDLCLPPPEPPEILGNWMRSASERPDAPGGKVVWARNPWEAVALARHLRRTGRAPHPHEWTAIGREGREYASEFRRLEEAEKADGIGNRAGELAGLRAALAETRALVFPGPVYAVAEGGE
jgi:hypothetical protein